MDLMMSTIRRVLGVESWFARGSRQPTPARNGRADESDSDGVDAPPAVTEEEGSGAGGEVGGSYNIYIYIGYVLSRHNVCVLDPLPYSYFVHIFPVLLKYSYLGYCYIHLTPSSLARPSHHRTTRKTTLLYRPSRRPPSLSPSRRGPNKFRAARICGPQVRGPPGPMRFSHLSTIALCTLILYDRISYICDTFIAPFLEVYTV